VGSTIRWLHLTDLHVGMDDQDWLWPRMRTKFRDDLESIYVLHMELPRKEYELTQFLVQRGRDRCSRWIDDEEVYREAAKQLLQDRQAATDARSPVQPGPAEYLDLVYAVGRMYPNDAARQKAEVRELREFVFRKESMDREE
jgi:hypothetical protein